MSCDISSSREGKRKNECLPSYPEARSEHWILEFETIFEAKLEMVLQGSKTALLNSFKSE